METDADTDFWIDLRREAEEETKVDILFPTVLNSDAVEDTEEEIPLLIPRRAETEPEEAAETTLETCLVTEVPERTPTLTETRLARP